MSNGKSQISNVKTSNVKRQKWKKKIQKHSRSPEARTPGSRRAENSPGPGGFSNLVSAPGAHLGTRSQCALLELLGWQVGGYRPI